MPKSEPLTTSDPYLLQSKYDAVKLLIADEGEKIAGPDTDTFKSIFDQVQNLHQFVRGPREQISDTEALLSITGSLLTGVKLLSNDEITPSNFITHLQSKFSDRGRSRSLEEGEDLIRWRDVGDEVSHFMRTCCGFQSMNGPMDLQLKQRKVPVRRRRNKNVQCDVPKLAHDEAEDKRETARGMRVIFQVLRKKRRAKLENLVLNRNSFARTVENIFALSFLVRDGRVEIDVDENGCHIVSARNAPSASQVTSGDAVFRHFVFRFDFQDWLVMKASVAEGEEELVCEALE